MADAARLSPLVKSGTGNSLEAFGVAVRAVLGEHPDLASEACWQGFGQLITEHWVGLCREQAPLQTWGMLVKCSETIAKLRQAESRTRGQTAADALEEFRSFMGEVLGDQEA